MAKRAKAIQKKAYFCVFITKIFVEIWKKCYYFSINMTSIMTLDVKIKYCVKKVRLQKP